MVLWLLRTLSVHIYERLVGLPEVCILEEAPNVCTIEDIQRLGEENLNDAARSYIGSGTSPKSTSAENIRAFTRLRFQPRVLVDVSTVTTATTVLGKEISFPVGLAPSALHKLANEIGEEGSAQAAEAAGTVMILSAMSSMTLEDVRARAPNLSLWQQIYLFRNRSLTESFVRRAAKQGCGAIVLTVDSPVAGRQGNLRRSNVRLLEGARFANLDASCPGHSFTFDTNSEDHIRKQISDSVTWNDVLWLQTITDLPIVIKGVLTPEAAVDAVNHGAAAVIVSNHGGRVLDGTPATIEALPAIVQAVGHRTEVYMDGGIRSGRDVAKAISLGARAVFVGRPVLWSLAYDGKKGVAKMLGILEEELVRTMQLLGCPHIQDLDKGFVTTYAMPSLRDHPTA